jgi:hypothetical protein
MMRTLKMADKKKHVRVTVDAEIDEMVQDMMTWLGVRKITDAYRALINDHIRKVYEQSLREKAQALEQGKPTKKKKE